MGGMFSPDPSPIVNQTPPPPPPLPPAAIPPTLATDAVKMAGANQAARAAAAAGQTVKTSPQGDLMPAPAAKPSLLGGT